VLDRRRVAGTGSRDRVEVKRDDSDTIGELLNVLASRLQAVEMVEFGQCAEVMRGTAHLVANEDTMLARALDLDDLDDGTIAVLNVLHNLLVNFQGVWGGALEE